MIDTTEGAQNCEDNGFVSEFEMEPWTDLAWIVPR